IPTQTAGTAFFFKVTAQDAFNNTQTSFAGTTAITSTSAITGGNFTTLPFTGGEFASQSITLETAGVGNQSITATGGGKTGTSNLFTINPSTPNNLFIFQEPSATATAGVAFARQPIVYVRDVFNNLVTTDNTTQVTATRNAGTGLLQGTT